MSDHALFILATLLAIERIESFIIGMNFEALVEE
jgi:hypothetical protein